MDVEKAVRQASGLDNGFVDMILPGIVTLIISGIIIYLIRVFLNKSLRHKDNLDEQQKKLFVRIVTTVLGIAAVVLVISGYGMPTNALLGMMGVVGLALSLSMQDLLSNFFSGCVLPITKPFREGDVIEISGKMGYVERIGYLHTTLVTIDNITVIIPNSSLTSGCITNYSTKETLQIEQTFSVAADMPDEEVRGALREAVGKDPRFLTDSEPFIHLKSFDSMNATYIVRVPCKSKEYFDVYYALVENVRASFEAHSIETGTETLGMGSMGQVSETEQQAGGFGGGVQRQSGGGRDGAQQQRGGTNSSHQA